MQKRFNYGLSVLIILFVSTVFGLICYYRPWLGDDVIGTFYMHMSYYFGDESLEHMVGIPYHVSNFWKDSLYYYLNWNGRVIYAVLNPILSMAGQGVVAVYSSVVYTAIVLVSMHVIYGNKKEVLNHPMILAVMMGFFMLFNDSLQYSVMRTMLTIYGLSLLFYMILMDLTFLLMRVKTDGERKGLCACMNITGVFAGLSHELFGAWFILQIALLLVFKYKGRVFRYMKYYFGLAVGYLFCFFAPGNFVRLRHPHESGFQLSVMERMARSLRAHINIMIPETAIGKFFSFAILGIMLICVGVAIGKQIRIQQLYKFMFFEISFFLSVVLWGIVPQAVIYGMIGAILYQLLAMAELVRAVGLKQERAYEYGGLFIGLAFFAVIVYKEFSWVPDLVAESTRRKELIAEAVRKNEKEVVVPAFSEKINEPVMFFSYVNSSEQYANQYYIAYYGTKVIIGE